jgi:hypothetical protein
VAIQIDIARSKNKAPTKLKWVSTQPMLTVSGHPRTLPPACVLASQQMEERGALQPRRSVSLALFIHQQRKLDTSFHAKSPSVIKVAQPNRCQPCSLFQKCLFVIAQLRDMLAAEDSSVVTKEHNDCRTVFPQIT